MLSAKQFGAMARDVEKLRHQTTQKLAKIREKYCPESVNENREILVKGIYLQNDWIVRNFGPDMFMRFYLSNEGKILNGNLDAKEPLGDERYLWNFNGKIYRGFRIESWQTTWGDGFGVHEGYRSNSMSAFARAKVKREIEDLFKEASEFFKDKRGDFILFKFFGNFDVTIKLGTVQLENTYRKEVY